MNKEALALAREGYGYAMEVLAQSQFNHPADHKDELEHVALTAACLFAGQQHRKLSGDDIDDLLERIEFAVTGIARNPLTWDNLDRAFMSAAASMWYQTLCPPRDWYDADATTQIEAEAARVAEKAARIDAEEGE